MTSKAQEKWMNRSASGQTLKHIQDAIKKVKAKPLPKEKEIDTINRATRLVFEYLCVQHPKNWFPLVSVENQHTTSIFNSLRSHVAKSLGFKAPPKNTWQEKPVNEKLEKLEEYMAKQAENEEAISQSSSKISISTISKIIPTQKDTKQNASKTDPTKQNASDLDPERSKMLRNLTQPEVKHFVQNSEQVVQKHRDIKPGNILIDEQKPVEEFQINSKTDPIPKQQGLAQLLFNQKFQNSSIQNPPSISDPKFPLKKESDIHTHATGKNLNIQIGQQININQPPNRPGKFTGSVLGMGVGTYTNPQMIVPQNLIQAASFQRKHIAGYKYMLKRSKRQYKQACEDICQWMIRNGYETPSEDSEEYDKLFVQGLKRQNLGPNEK